MASVTERIKQIKQPRGGYIKPSDFEVIRMDDNIELNEEENVHASIIGMAVDYLTRFAMGAKLSEAFKISLTGVKCAKDFGMRNADKIGTMLLSNIKDLDEESIINACKLVSFDVWYRSPLGAMMSKGYSEINPDEPTIQNIQILVRRSIAFFEKYGDVVKDGFDFQGGYTETVSSGDGDFLTKDTLWDFKVSKSAPTNKHTLQLLMYWIMGQHSKQKIFKDISKLGIFNPRLNTVYLLDIAKIPKNIIKTVENDVICY